MTSRSLTSRTSAVGRPKTSLDIGRALARQAFQVRGNHSEIHLSEVQLAALLAIAAKVARGVQRPPVVDGGARFEAATNQGIDY